MYKFSVKFTLIIRSAVEAAAVANANRCIFSGDLTRITWKKFKFLVVDVTILVLHERNDKAVLSGQKEVIFFAAGQAG